MLFQISIIGILGIITILNIIMYNRTNSNAIVLQTKTKTKTKTINENEKEKENVAGGIPINIRTRGEESYQNVGTMSSVYDSSSTTILPLYGRPTYYGSSKWNYFTSTDGYHMIQIPVFYHDKRCTHEYGCDEISDGDIVYVKEYGKDFEVTLYDNYQARYIPY